VKKNPIKPRAPTKIKVGRNRYKELSLKTNETTIGNTYDKLNNNTRILNRFIIAFKFIILI
tara:strand:- start:308 stop:490 length:183 start_codon:yes stop_codon:yes gene_type:complete